MARLTRTIDLLPEIFRTETNEKFLNATLDQIVQQPQLKRVEGFIGQKTGLGVDGSDSYVLEKDQERSVYQLEPAVVLKETDTEETKDFLTYPGIVDALQANGALTDRHDRLFESEVYAWDPFIDYDKFVNFAQYYWLPSGPDSVDVGATEISTSDEYDVTRDEFAYNFSGVEGGNPTITIVRGGNYTFNVQQTGFPFYIQSDPGAEGTVHGQPNQSSRDVLGVTNNGEDNGVVEFNVPQATDQNFYLKMDVTDKVDLATELRFDEINNQQLIPFLKKYDGIDEIQDLRNRTIIFLNKNPGDGDDSGWKRDSRYDAGLFDDDGEPFAESSDISSKTDRYSIYRIEYVYEVDEDSPDFDATGSNPIMILNKVKEVPELTKVHIQYGTDHNNMYYWKTAEGFFERQPLITATRDVLYYQDGVDTNRFGIIRVVDAVNQLTLNVGEDIIGQETYTSPTGIKFTNGLKVQFRGQTEPPEYQDKEYYVEGVGTSIKLIPVTVFQTPESFTNSQTEPYDMKGYDSTPYDASLNAPTQKDYMTINRGSPDENPWTRSNRWFHISVITQSAEYNKQDVNLDNVARAKRPILEFHDGLRLFNFGTKGKAPVTIIDTKQTDALSNVAGKIGYGVDGILLSEGARIIFAADEDPQVRNKIYEVHFVDPVGITQDPAQISEDIIQLVKAEDGDVLEDETTYVLSGATQQGKSYRYTGTEWVETQQKTKVNQPPLFDIYDAEGHQIGDSEFYPSTNFAGTKLFSYAEGNGQLDSELDLRLKYANINNVGDIVFENNLYSDTFTYTVDNISTTEKVSIGFVRKYFDRTTFILLTGWVKASESSRQAQIFTFTDKTVCVCDIAYNSGYGTVTVHVDNKYVSPDNYTLTKTEDTTTVTLEGEAELVHIRVISDQVSDIAYYEIPSNLSDNSVNTSFETVTLGTVRSHYVSLAQATPGFEGDILGENNIKDIGNVPSYGSQIVEQSAPMQFTALFSKDSTINFFDSVEYASVEYEKFKNRLVDTLTKNDYQGSAPERLDQAFQDLNRGKNSDMPFYWSDTIPVGQGVFDETKQKVTAISDNIFDTLYTYDFTKANYQALLVYVDDVQLIKDIDYTVATDGPRITIDTDKTPLVSGSSVTIKEYQTTQGSFVPPTPTKMGLFDKFIPTIYTDDSYTTPQKVIQGHDGSKTIAYGDNRDEVLLEFERRIYNNIKLPNTNLVPLRWQDVVPGAFRTTDYTDGEIVDLLSESFLIWVSQNKLDYKTQDYDVDNKKTWNYSTSTNRLNGELLKGGFRGNLLDFYDTDIPHLHPWELLGLTEKPSWWVTTYGPAPYTGDNLVLWDDLALGLIKDPDNPRVDERFIREGLQTVIPTAGEGDLQSNFDVLVNNYDLSSTEKSWQVGDVAPTEAAWRRSSAWPFAVMKLLAQTKPAQFFALMADRDMYKYSPDLDQYVYDDRFRLTSENLEIYGDGTIKHSYINWCVDYARRQGITNKQEIEDTVRNTKIQLVYRAGGFTDKQYLKVYTEKSSPESSNTDLLLPDESFEILLYRNEPFDEVTYSSVVVQQVEGGYAVFGNSRAKPYFTVFESIPNGNFKNVTVGDDTIRVSLDFNNREVLVPYGYTFTSKSQVVDFLSSYGYYLESKGFVFEDKENEYILNWGQMINEFMYWAQQGWVDGAIVNLNPSASELRVEQEGAVAMPIMGKRIDEFVFDQNQQPIHNDELVWDRIGNELRIRSLNETAISFLRVKFTNYEHALVFDNTSIFNDLIYDPATGARQKRLKLVGTVSDNWDGTVNAPGFILNEDNVEEWQPNSVYSKGDIVKYKNKYYSALTHVDPAELFDFADWIETEYDEIKTGLLPNIALKADESEEYYNTSIANLENDADQLGFGLIGFRAREYMQGLSLDDVSQVNIYQDFIGNKGSKQAMDLFKSAYLDKEQSDYNIYENWAVRTGAYGATANRSYIELNLDSDLLTGNPGTIKVSDEISTTVNQQVPLSQIYKSSFKVTDDNIIPTTDYLNVEHSLPDAGFVNIEDVTIRVYELSDLTNIEANLDQIEDGTKIWVAKDNRYSWNVYRTTVLTAEPISIVDNLDGTSTLEFNGFHTLNKDNIIVIKYFDDSVNGAYDILSVPTLEKVVIPLELGEGLTQIKDIGIGFVLESVKVDQASDVADLPFVNDLTTGELIWVDSEQWQVYKKTNPFNDPKSTYSKTLNNPEEDSMFGQTVSQTPNGQTSLISAPLKDGGRGSVFIFGEINKGDLLEGTELKLGTGSVIDSGVAGYGTSIDSGNYGWHVIGAPDTESEEGLAVVVHQENGGLHKEVQALKSPVAGAGRFGQAVAISLDSKWIYVGAPEIDRVFAYQRIEYEQQKLILTGDGFTTIFKISDDITVTDENQLAVNVNNIVKVPSVDYVVAGGNIIFTSAPLKDARIEITRIYTWQEEADGSTITYDISSIYHADSIDSFRVLIDGQLLTPDEDYTFDDTAKTITFDLEDSLGNPIAPPDGELIQIIAEDYFKYVTTIPNPGIIGNKFGSSLATTKEGRQVVIGAVANDGSDSVTDVGQAYVFDRDTERFQAKSKAELEFETTKDIQSNPTVLVNDEEIFNSGNFLYKGSYTRDGNTITIDDDAVDLGDIIEVETNNFVLASTLDLDTKTQNSEFGYSVRACTTNCSVYVGAPLDSTQIDDGGSVTRFVNRSRLYGVTEGTIANPVLTSGNSLRINNYYVTATGTTVESFVQDIITKDIPNVTASVVGGKIKIELINPNAAPVADKLFIYPGEGIIHRDLGIELFPRMQTIYNPFPLRGARFGHSMDISNDARSIVIGAPRGATNLEVTFDENTTKLDSGATTIKDTQTQSGAVYTYDYLPSSLDSYENPGRFVYGQQINDTLVHPLSEYGTSVDYANARLLIGAPQHITDGDRDGRVVRFVNEEQTPVWQVVEEQTPVVDTKLLNTTFIYDKTTDKVLTYLDYIDPLQGKILGAAKQNIDILIPDDPAQYNNGTDNNFGMTWGNERVGIIWWDVSTCKFINYYQSTEDFRAKRIGQLFPGSTIDVYQWISSDTPPSEYEGEGTVYDETSFSTLSDVTAGGEVVTKFYFWVKGITSISKDIGKTLSPVTISQYIENPKASGIPYMAAINENSFALFNSDEYINNKTSVFHVEYDKIETDNNVHLEYELIRQDDPTQFLSDNLYRKYLDSFCGTDTAGNIVPDPNLSITDRRGVDYRPRQTMFVDRFTALKNYIDSTNRTLLTLPITEIRSYPLLDTKEEIPSKTSGAWDVELNNVAELSYQNLNIAEVGTKYLVKSDENNNDLWTIYTLQEDKTLLLTRVQNYRTDLYWYEANWFAEDYNILDKPTYEVNLYADLATLTTAEVGAIAKITENAQGKFEVYRLETTGWERVGLENGTIQFSEALYNYDVDRNGFDNEVFDAQYFDQEAVIETRQIIRSINEELFVDDLAIHRIDLITLMFNYVLSEQQSTDWLVKTSLIDLEHTLRELEQFPILRRDNQDYIQQYIQEVKPYRTQIKEFSLIYKGMDIYDGSVTDFDLPAQFNSELNKYVSPRHILGETTPSGEGVYQLDDPIWYTPPYIDWRGNFALIIDSVTIVDQGSGYTEAPNIVVSGDCTVPAELSSRVSPSGELLEVYVDYPGEGYLTTPVITVESGSGGGAVLTPVTTPGNVRSYKVKMKFDRYEYAPNVVNWEPETAYEQDQLVRYNNKVYKVEQGDGSTLSSETFDPAEHTLMDAEDLSGVDRTMGLYQPDANYPGLDLSLLIYGTEYPGVQMTGPGFDQNTGYDVGGYDVNPYDNIDVDENGKPTYSESILDTKYEGGDFISYGGTESYDVERENKNFELTTSRPDATHGDLEFDEEDPWLWSWESDFYRPTGGDNEENPIITLKRGSTYKFYNYTYGHRLWLKTQPLSEAEFDAGLVDLYKLGDADGVINNGAKRESVEDEEPVVVTWKVPLDYPHEAVTIQHSQAGMADSLKVSGEIITATDERPADIDVEGGAFVDTYSSHAPEELVPGRMFDTLNMVVNTRPGADNLNQGWAGKSQSTLFNFDGTSEETRTVSFDGLVDVPFAVFCTEVEEGRQLEFDYGDTPEGVVDYTVNWGAKTITFADGRFTQGEVIAVTAHAPGGGNQLHTEDYLADTYLVPDGQAEIILPVNHAQIKEVVVLVNGQEINNWTLTTYETFETVISIGDRDIDGNGKPDVDSVANGQTRRLQAGDYIHLTVIGYDSSASTGALLSEWSEDIKSVVSYPMATNFVIEDNSILTYPLDFDITGKGMNPEFAQVAVDGLRARPPEGCEHTADGTEVDFAIELETNIVQGLVADNDITVYVDEEKQRLYTDYIISPYDGSSDRLISFATAPADGVKVKIFVHSEAPYRIDETNNTITFKKIVDFYIGARISVITHGDVRQLDSMTKCYQGPTTTGITSRETFDEKGFDTGEFDKQVGVSIEQSVFDLGREITLPERLVVHVANKRKFYGTDWRLLSGSNRHIEFFSLEVDTLDIVSVSMVTENQVPATIAFNLFKDMQDNAIIYRSSEETTATLIQQLSKSDDHIYVDDVTKLPGPNLEQGIFGAVMINGERILYRYKHKDDNSVSGLRRGTAGTAIATHIVGDKVINQGKENYLDYDYNQTWYSMEGVPLGEEDTVPAKFLRRES